MTNLIVHTHPYVGKCKLIDIHYETSCEDYIIANDPSYNFGNPAHAADYAYARRRANEIRRAAFANMTGPTPEIHGAGFEHPSNGTSWLSERHVGCPAFMNREYKWS